MNLESDRPIELILSTRLLFPEPAKLRDRFNGADSLAGFLKPHRHLSRLLGSIYKDAAGHGDFFGQLRLQCSNSFADSRFCGPLSRIQLAHPLKAG